MSIALLMDYKILMNIQYKSNLHSLRLRSCIGQMYRKLSHLECHPGNNHNLHTKRAFFSKVFQQILFHLKLPMQSVPEDL